jgi:phosphoribosylaminoimidazole-succinocarboxamide synthase
MALPEIIYEGSVKNVRGVRGQSPYVFEFSDRYSIFDWGQMPDQLNDKGASLAFMGWFFFHYMGKPETWADWHAPKTFSEEGQLRALKEHGLRHHAIGLVDHAGLEMPVEREVLAPTRCMAVEPVAVLPPKAGQKDGKLAWDYSAYQDKPENALVPLEVIFRFGVPEGSSLLSRADNAEYCKSIGLSAPPRAGDVFETPVIEYSTKLETSDRYVTVKEAQELAGLSADELRSLGVLAQLIALRLKDCFAGIGIELWDGKLEFAFGLKNRNGLRDFMLVDTIGPDELRLIKDGQHLSKEALRGFYRPTAWYKALETAKALARERGEKDWKRICSDELKAVPPLLAPGVKQRVEMVYKGIARALSEKYLAHVIFADAWPLEEIAAGFAAKKQDVA